MKLPYLDSDLLYIHKENSQAPPDILKHNKLH